MLSRDGTIHIITFYHTRSKRTSYSWYDYCISVTQRCIHPNVQNYTCTVLHIQYFTNSWSWLSWCRIRHAAALFIRLRNSKMFCFIHLQLFSSKEIIISLSQGWWQICVFVTSQLLRPFTSYRYTYRQHVYKFCFCLKVPGSTPISIKRFIQIILVCHSFPLLPFLSLPFCSSFRTSCVMATTRLQVSLSAKGLKNTSGFLQTSDPFAIVSVRGDDPDNAPLIAGHTNVWV